VTIMCFGSAFIGKPNFFFIKKETNTFTYFFQVDGQLRATFSMLMQQDRFGHLNWRRRFSCPGGRHRFSCPGVFLG